MRTLKTLGLFLAAFLFSAAVACAQAPLLDPVTQEAVTALLPSKYVTYGPGLVILIMILGRAIPALQKGGGLVGWIKAVLFGTNTPSKLPLLLAGMSLLSLSSCATTAAFLSSPFGRAVISSADSLGKAVIQTTEKAGLEQIILQATAKVAALKSEGVNPDPIKEILRGSQTTAFVDVIEAAQVKYEQLTGKRFTLPKNPVKVTL